MTTQLIIYGASGFGREVTWLALSQNQGDYAVRYAVCAFADDDSSKHGTALNDIPVMSLEAARKAFPDARFVPAVGSPQIREQMVTRALALGLEPQTVIADDVLRSEFVTVGDGAVICAGNILTVNITIGSYVQINLGCTIGHDAVFEDYATLAPGVHVSGCVHIGKRAYIGTGAVIINGEPGKPLCIGDGAIIGAGACVVRDIPAGITAVGVPARPLTERTP